MLLRFALSLFISQVLQRNRTSERFVELVYEILGLVSLNLWSRSAGWKFRGELIVQVVSELRHDFCVVVLR